MTPEEIAALENETEPLRREHSYETYLLTTRKVPSQKNYECYLKELRKMGQQGKRITASEAEQVEARRTWTDFVAETYKSNQASTLKQDVKGKVIDRLRKSGVASPEAMYSDCMNFLEEHAILTVTFGGFGTNLNFLWEKGLTDFQLLNIHERPNVQRPLNYAKSRHRCEKALVQSMPETLKKRFVDNIHARPRYGAIKFIDTPIEATGGYGSSFVVLKDIAKYNTIFVPGDSLCHYWSKGRNYEVCTIHNLEFLLWQCPWDVLQNIVKAIDDGRTATEKAYLNRYYFEVMLPAINLFDQNLVEHIYIDANAYQMPKEAMETLELMGIKVTNIAKPKHVHQKVAYASKTKPFLQAIQDNNVNDLDGLSNKYPKILENLGNVAFRQAIKSDSRDVLVWLVEKQIPLDPTLLHTACFEDRIDCLEYLLDQNMNINAMDSLGDTPLMTAVRNGKKDVMHFLLDNDADISRKNNRNETVLDIAIKRHPKLLEPILLKAVDLKDPGTLLNKRSQAEMKKIFQTLIQDGQIDGLLAYFLLEIDKMQKVFEKSKHKNPQYMAAFEAASILNSKMKIAFYTYRDSAEEDKPQARSELLLSWKEALVAAKQSALANHRGKVKNLLANLGLLLLSAIVFYPIVAKAASYFATGKGHFFYTTKTSSFIELENLGRNLKKIE
jgi:hypothetical protein